MQTLKSKGVVAGSHKALQSSLRHLSWQTRMIAKGDFSQRVNFMGEFSESFNSMVRSLAEARDEIKRHAEKLMLANAELTAEISERKRAEEALREARDTLEERVEERTKELSRLNESLKAEIAEREAVEEALQRSMARLEWANRELGNFTFIASHDLQEPLRKIQILGDLLASKAGNALGDEALEVIGRMRAAAERMRSQVHALTEYSRFTRQVGDFCSTDLNRSVAEVLTDLGTQINEVEGTFEVSELPTIIADPGQIAILFRHLIGNALKFRGEMKPLIKIYCGKIEEGETFTGSADSPSYHIFVEDNGIGFDGKYRDRIFKPFQRLHRGAEHEGTGMGLAICRRIVERHGGSLTARSTPGKGATFVVSLPMRRKEPTLPS